MSETYWMRSEYMGANGHADRVEGMRLHRRFWSQFVDDRTVAYVVASVGADVLASSELARLGPETGDVHLNDINEHGWQGSLPNWDRAGYGAPKACHPSDVGLSGFSPSDLVCIAKEAARQYIEQGCGVSTYPLECYGCGFAADAVAFPLPRRCPRCGSYEVHSPDAFGGAS